MRPSSLGRALASILLIVPSVTATPFYNSLAPLINARDLYVPLTSTCNDLGYGNNGIKVGKVCVGVSDGILTVNYGTISPFKYSSVHVYVGTTPPTDRAPGNLGYSSDKGAPPACTLGANNATASCSIPVQNTWRGCGKTLYIATHAAIESGTSKETAWGLGTCFGGTGGNCAKYWRFDVQCFCKTTSTYDPVTYTVRTIIHILHRLC
jgi:hypothetical protein